MSKTKKQKKFQADEAPESSPAIGESDESAVEEAAEETSPETAEGDFPSEESPDDSSADAGQDDSAGAGQDDSAGAADADNSEPAVPADDSPRAGSAKKSPAKSAAKESKPSAKIQKSKAPAKAADSDAQEDAPPATKVLRAGVADKLSGRSLGAIHYEVGEDADGEVKLRLTRNEGGGTFSKEWLSLPRIAEAVAEPDQAGRSFHATRLKSAFAGRSTNNAPFLAAALVAEGLLAKSDEETRKVMLRVARAPESWPDALRQGKPLGKLARRQIERSEPVEGPKADEAEESPGDDEPE
jgi:hypothetical protein